MITHTTVQKVTPKGVFYQHATLIARKLFLVESYYKPFGERDGYKIAQFKFKSELKPKKVIEEFEVSY